MYQQHAQYMITFSMYTRAKKYYMTNDNHWHTKRRNGETCQVLFNFQPCRCRPTKLFRTYNTSLYTSMIKNFHNSCVPPIIFLQIPAMTLQAAKCMQMKITAKFRQAYQTYIQRQQLIRHQRLSEVNQYTPDITIGLQQGMYTISEINECTYSGTGRFICVLITK